MTGTIVIIIVVIIVVAAIVAGVMYQRRRRLQQRFGPEYDRMVEEKGSKTKAEAELASRQRRVAGLDIRPLDPAARARYQENWAAVQEQFVDSPQEAVMAAQRLVMTVMQERGYPTEGGDQVMADLSVDHASVLDHYRAAYDISQRAADNQASTEDLRQAMIHYRALFQDLLGQTSDHRRRDAGHRDHGRPARDGRWARLRRWAPATDPATRSQWPTRATLRPTRPRPCPTPSPRTSTTPSPRRPGPMCPGSGAPE